MHEELRYETLNLRRRTSRDDKALFELFNEEGFQEMAATREAFASIEEMAQWWTKSFPPRRFEIVGECDGEAVGFAGLYLMEDQLSHIGWFWLGVKERSQRRGVGTALLKALLATAEIIVGLQRIQLTVFCGNDAALKLYEKFGFEIEGRHKRFLRRGATFVDALTMAKLLEHPRPAASNAELLRRIQELRPFWSIDDEKNRPRTVA